MDEFEFISPIPEERYDEVIVHLRKNFFADEPLNKSQGLCKPGEPHAELEAHSLNTLRDQLSVMAVDKLTDKVLNVESAFKHCNFSNTYISIKISNLL